MKNLTTFIFLFFCFTSFVQGQTQDDLKRALNMPINEIFNVWEDEWFVDKYIEESARISSFEESTYSDKQILALGSFKVRRFGKTISVAFTAKVNEGSGNLIIKSLCYDDDGDKGCCNPRKYGLDKVN